MAAGKELGKRSVRAVDPDSGGGDPEKSEQQENGGQIDF
jgi:hypothetical protein